MPLPIPSNFKKYKLFVKKTQILINKHIKETKYTYLWTRLLNLMISRSDSLLIFGDFSFARCTQQRLNSHLCPYNAVAFNNFIMDSRLMKFNIGGRTFTHFWDDGLKVSNLDNFLCCANFSSIQYSSSITVSPREHSNLSSIILLSKQVDFGPPSF